MITGLIVLGYLAIGWLLAPVTAGQTCKRAIASAKRDLEKYSYKKVLYKDAYKASEFDREMDGPAVYTLTIPFWPVIGAYYVLSALLSIRGVSYRSRMIKHDPALRAQEIEDQQKRIAELERELGIGDK